MTLSPADWPAWLRWPAMLALTVAFMAGLELLHISAALLIAAMCAAAIFATMDAQVDLPRPLFDAGKAVVGCIIARAMVPSIGHELMQQWPLFLAAILSVLAAAIVLGVLLTWLHVLPGTTPIWGSFPGAATAMTLMSENYGADMRLVAFMQYLRAALTAIAASGVARIWAGHAPTAGSPTAWANPIAWGAFAETMGVAAVGATLARLLKIPAGTLIVPMVLAALLQDFAGMKIELPAPVLAIAYTVVGWGIGLRFTRETVGGVAHAFWQVLAVIVTLIVLCGLFAVALVYLGGYDPLTAYLAMSPGGVDSVAIIASSSSEVKMPFVMSLQMIRFVVVLVTGPALAKFIAKRMHTPDETE